MTTAAIYARLSDDKRRGTDAEGLNVDEQIADCRAFIDRQGWTVGTVYRDDSISATKELVRPAFERLLQDAPPIVVAWRSSRLSRDVMDTLRIKSAGISGYLTDGGRLDFSSGDATMLTMIRSVVDAAEGEKKAEFQRQANLRDAKAGKWHYSRPVFGNDRVTGALIPDEAEAIRAGAKTLVDENENGSFYKIALAWNAAGHLTPVSKGAGGKLWTAGTVRTFYMAPRLIGERVYNGETYTMEGWQAVLDKDTWQTIQDQIDANRTGKRGVQGTRHMPHMLTSIATCGTVVGDNEERCGLGMNIGYRGGKGSARVYRCTAPKHVSRVADPLERFVVEKFLYLLMHDGADHIVHPEGAATSGKLRIERATLIKAYDAWNKEANEIDLSAKAIKAKEVSHTAKLAEIDARLLESLKETSFAMLLSEVPQAPELMWERWDSVPMDHKRAIVRSLFKKIEVRPSPQGARFRPSAIRLEPTALMMQLVDLNN